MYEFDREIDRHLGPARSPAASTRTSKGAPMVEPTTAAEREVDRRIRIATMFIALGTPETVAVVECLDGPPGRRVFSYREIETAVRIEPEELRSILGELAAAELVGHVSGARVTLTPSGGACAALIRVLRSDLRG